MRRLWFWFKLIPDVKIAIRLCPHADRQINGEKGEGRSMFQPAVSVAEVLERVHSNEYLLPAIQREFVWNTSQIRALFDSVMRGYPIGSFLLWKVNPANVGAFTFYNFITDYHEKDQPYATKAHVPSGSGLTAVLDGQQRLTALNIGIYGSHAERLYPSSGGAIPMRFRRSGSISTCSPILTMRNWVLPMIFAF